VQQLPAVLLQPVVLAAKMRKAVVKMQKAIKKARLQKLLQEKVLQGKVVKKVLKKMKHLQKVCIIVLFYFKQENFV
jgi:hypothetical protein